MLEASINSKKVYKIFIEDLWEIYRKFIDLSVRDVVDLLQIYYNLSGFGIQTKYWIYGQSVTSGKCYRLVYQVNFYLVYKSVASL